MNVNFNIHAIGYNKQEHVGVLIDRPVGSNDYLFIHYLSNAIVNITGTSISIHPGACILYTPDFPQWYCSPDCKLKNSFFHFDGIEASQLFEHLSIPLNQIFYPNDSTYIEMLLEILESEVILKDSYWEYTTNGILLQLFSRIGRACSSKETYRSNPAKLELFEKFKMVRFEILQHPEYPWTLNKMALLTNLCVSRFSIYYKEFFRISPILDLISARIEKAKTLLTNEALTVSEVAEQLGYNNVFHFIRQFKTITGSSPGKWKH